MRPIKYEIVGNFHLHTNRSDGAGDHAEVAWAAAEAGLDAIIYTDHNVWTPGQEGWYTHPPTGRQVLLLMGEEVHDEERLPPANHYLCFGAGRDMCEYAAQPQALIDAVRQQGGVGIIAHPIERAAPLFDQSEFPWVDWDVAGFTGIELWNTMSEFKAYLSSKPAAIAAAYFPGIFIRGPFSETLALWNDLLRGGQKVVAIGGSDAHARVYRMGPLRRRIFPYTYLFRGVNTHLLLETPLSRDFPSARAQVLDALRAGHAFVAYGLAGSARGFRFTGVGQQGNASMGDEISLNSGRITLSARSPLSASLRLLKDGREVTRVRGNELAYETQEPGVYRVEAYRRYRLKLRGWVFSNPIYVRS
jgi:hypothetical protein